MSLPNSWSIQLLDASFNPTGAAQTLAQLGIENADFDFNNLAADVWTLTVGGADFDAAALWPYGQSLIVLRPDGTRAFFGRVEPWSREGTGASQNHLGRLVNPWWYLTQKLYQQRYTLPTLASYPNLGQPNKVIAYTTYTTPRVVLNILFNGAAGTGFYPATTGQQIADAVNWAISQGAPITLGVCDPGTLPFSDYQQGILCSDVIKHQFRKEPDFVVDWDYTTVPFPTIHFRKAGKSLVPLTVDLTIITRREQVNIKERPDWQRSYVSISYDQLDTIPAGQILEIFDDLYPNPIPAGTEAKFRGVDLFCDLKGSVQSTTSQTATFASQSFDINSLATWQNWVPELAAGTVYSAIIMNAGSLPPADASRPAPTIAPQDENNANGPIPYDPTCLYEVVDGEWADWVTDPNGNQINSQRVRVLAWFQIVTMAGEIHYTQHHKDLTVVSYNTGGISQSFLNANSSITQYSEPPPIGLAQAMWQSWQNLAIEGRLRDVAAICPNDITRSNSLNFLTANPGVNGRPDWRRVNALVQRISGSIATGTRTVQFGAPLHITGHELISAILATRFRVTTIDLNFLFGGLLAGGKNGVTFGRKTHARHVGSGGRHTQKEVISQAITPVIGVDPTMSTDGATGTTTWTPPGTAAAPATGSVIMDPSKVKGSDGNWHTCQLAEVKICVTIGGVQKQRTCIALVSDIYQAPGDPT